MSRNSSGTYTLPAGNPVVTGTVITSTWGNTTMGDIATALTDSLSRTGLGSMLAGLELFDGTSALPGLAWGTELTSGMYRAGAGDFRWVIGTTELLALSSNTIRLSGTTPVWQHFESDAAANEKLWRIALSGGDLVWGTRDDANSAGNDFLTIGRTSTTVDSIAWAATAMSFNGVFTYSATPLAILLSSTAPAQDWNETDAAVDNRRWRIQVNGEQWRLGPVNDAVSVFTPSITIDRTGTATDLINLVGPVTVSAQELLVTQSSPRYSWLETGVTADNGRWRIVADSEDLHFQTRTDADSIGATFVQVSRTGTTVDSISLAATTITLSGTVVDTGGSIEVEGATPFIIVDETDAPADERQWRFRSVAGDFFLSTFTDASVLGNSALTFTRTGTTVDAATISATTITLGGVVNATGSALEIQSTNPILRLNDTNAGSNEKIWRLTSNGTSLSLETRTDADGAGNTAVDIVRTGTSVSQITLQVNATSAPSIALSGTGATAALTFSGEVQNGTSGKSSGGVGMLGFPQNSQSANYNLVAGDTGKQILHPNGGGAGDTFTIPSNATEAFSIGTKFLFVNRDSNNLSIAISTDTMILSGSTTTGTRTLAQNGVALAVKVEATTWIIINLGGLT